VDLAHSVAFRSGLGSSLFAPSHSNFTAEDIKSYASSTFSKENIAILGTDIDQGLLTKLVEKSLGKSLSSAASTKSTPSSYFGGSTRVESAGPQTFFVGFGAAGASASSAELAILAAHLSPQPSVKWSQGISPLATAIPFGASVTPVYLPYSDATLFGLLIQAETTELVKEAGKAVATALKAAGTLKGDDLKKAITKAKFTAASALEARGGLVDALGLKVRRRVCCVEVMLC
jgi:ubiquinol-cytochrome c reductase core subunit 2